MGRWMRKYSIDEFPQLLNVMRVLHVQTRDRFAVSPHVTSGWRTS